jgi:hypothetical protein
VNDPRNLLQVCCLLDDSAAIIKWGAMQNGTPTTWSSTVASSVGSVNKNHDIVEDVLYAAVGMVLATSATIDEN